MRRDTKATSSGFVGRIARDWFRASHRGVVEFLIVVGALGLAEPTTVSLVIGACVAFTGELLRVVTAGYGYKVGELSLRGPYRFVRHPYFLGTALLFFGLCIAARDPYVMGFALAAMTLVYRVDVRHDEERLARHLGPAFAEYRAQVPAFVPQLLPASRTPEDNRSFSLEHAVLKGRHRELDALLGLALAFGLLYVCKLVPAKDLFHLGVVITVAVYLVGRILYFGVARKGKRPAAL